MEPFCLVHLWSNGTLHVEFVRVGLSPYNAPGVFSLLAATELIDWVWYPVGDFGKVGEALAQVGSESWCRDSHKCVCGKHWSQRWEGNALWLRQVYLLKWRYQRRHCCFWFSVVQFALQLLFWIPFAAVISFTILLHFSRFGRNSQNIFFTYLACFLEKGLPWFEICDLCPRPEIFSLFRNSDRLAGTFHWSEVQLGWYLPPQMIPLAENRFLQAGTGAENTKEKSRQGFLSSKLLKLWSEF